MALAPPLYWGGQWVANQGMLIFLKDAGFQRYFNRAMLVTALALLWPTVVWLRIGSVRELGLQPDLSWKKHLLEGFATAGLAVAAMAAVYVALDFYHWKSELPFNQLPKIALSALVVAVLEESLFRGAILGLLKRTMRPQLALLAVTALFTSVHFLKPDATVKIGEVTWLSGMQLLPSVFHQFVEPTTLVAGFSTIFVLGWVLGYATVRTGALWMSIGFHAGVVFVKMGFSKFTKRDAMALPWVGDELQIGLVPVGVLALAGVCLWWMLKGDSACGRPAPPPCTPREL